MFSDHGFTAVKKEVNINAWLHRKGKLFLERKSGFDYSGLSEDSKALSMVPGRVYLLTERRWRRGRISDQLYEKERKEILSCLLELQNIEGEKLFERVLMKEEVFKGPYSDMGPDLIIEPLNGYDLKAGYPPCELLVKGPISGMHTKDDALLCVNNLKISQAKPVIYDVMPTILEVMGIEPPGDIDGKSLIP